MALHSDQILDGRKIDPTYRHYPLRSPLLFTLNVVQTPDALSSSHTSHLDTTPPRFLNTWLIVFIHLPSGRTYLRRKKRQRQTSSTSRPCWMYLLNSFSSSGTYGNGKTSRETSSSLVVTTQSKGKKKQQTVNTQRAVHMEIKLAHDLP